jgi:hypothetical protein
MARSSSASMSPDSTPWVSHAGSWLCHRSVCPRTRWPLRFAAATSSSAAEKSSSPRTGSITSHFITFSAVIELNSVPTRAR